MSAIKIAKRPESNEISRQVSDSYPRWIFSPGQSLDITDLIYSVDVVERGVITELILKPFGHSNHSDSFAGVHNGRPVKKGEIVQDDKTPQAQAETIVTNYGKMGAVSIEPFINVDGAMVGQVMQILMPTVPATLKKTRQWLGSEAQQRLQKSPAPMQVKSLATQVLSYLRQACELAWRHQNDHLNSTEKELQNAQNGRNGKGTLDDTDTLYYEQTERETPKQKTLQYDRNPEEGETGIVDRLVDAISGRKDDDDKDAKIRELTEKLENVEDLVNQKVADAMKAAGAAKAPKNQPPAQG